MKARDLKTEYLYDPIGIDITSPRFFWKAEGGCQSAYQIKACKDGEEIWDSGKVISSRMTHIPYEGPSLSSRDRVDIFVTLWDENDEPGQKERGSFEIGLLEKSDWSAKWISGAYKPKKNTRYPVDCFKKSFTAKENIVKARLYITACGLYEAFINGKKAGDFVLAPGSTDYRKRIQYQTYDVTDLIKSGENALEIELADGWYRGSVGCFAPTNVFGRQTKLLAQLEITYKGGASDVIGTDESFPWSNDGPVRFADLEDGEIIDASMMSSYSGKAVVVKEDIIPSASDNVAVTKHERLRGEITKTPSGKIVIDFGQNIAGFIAFELEGVKGQKIKLTMGEILDENGEFTQENMQEKTTKNEMSQMQQIMLITGNSSKLKCETKMSPAQIVEYTCKGGEEKYETRFAVFGFRYALVETELDLSGAVFEAVAVYSDLEVTGSFECSDERVNKLWENTMWSMKGNYADVPTDCPTRERLGWTGDAQIFFRTGAYMMDTAAFFRKWMRDMRDNQKKDGKISAVIPYNGCSMVYDNTGASAGWADAAILIPYRYYEAYGDIDILKENYPMMKAFAEFMIKNTGHKDKKAAKADPLNKYVYEKGMHLGEWLEPEEFNEAVTAGTKTLHTEEATAYLHYSMSYMAKAAAVLGYVDDEARYTEYAEGASKAYSALILKGKAPDTDRAAKLVRPLAMGIGTDEERAAMKERLAQGVVNKDYCVMTGFLSTPYMLPVLTDSGRSDLAYKMLLNEKKPGWLYEVGRGATTIWENWEGTLSQNHYSPGAVCQWLMETAAGIKQTGPGEFILSPHPDPNALNFAKGCYKSLYGDIECGWRIDAQEIIYNFKIPFGMKAKVILPGEKEETLEGGIYERRQGI